MSKSSESPSFDIFAFFIFFWVQKWLVLFILICVVGAMLIKLSFLEDEYKAEVVLASGLGDAPSAVVKIASLAGISGTDGVSMKVVGLALLESRTYLADFAQRHSLQLELLGVRGWDKTSNDYKFNSEIVDAETGIWINPNYKTNEYALSSALLRGLEVAEEPATGLVYLSFYHFSPEFCIRVVELLVQDLNENLKERAESKSRKRIRELARALENAEYASIKNLIYKVLEEELKTLSLAGDTDAYAFEMLTAPSVPAVPDRPNRKLLLALSIIFGFALSGLIALARDAALSRSLRE